MLRYGQDYVDADANYYESQYQQRALCAAKRRAAKLGYQLVPIPDGEDRASGVPPSRGGHRRVTTLVSEESFTAAVYRTDF